jgi:hypothetical protein
MILNVIKVLNVKLLITKLTYAYNCLEIFHPIGWSTFIWCTKRPPSTFGNHQLWFLDLLAFNNSNNDGGIICTSSQNDHNFFVDYVVFNGYMYLKK